MKFKFGRSREKGVDALLILQIKHSTKKNLINTQKLWYASSDLTIRFLVFERKNYIKIIVLIDNLQRWIYIINNLFY